MNEPYSRHPQHGEPTRPTGGSPNRQMIATLAVLATLVTGLVAAAATVSVPFIERALRDRGIGPEEPDRSALAPPSTPPSTRAPSPAADASRKAYIGRADQLCEQAFVEAGKVVERETDRLARFEEITLIHSGLLIQWSKIEPPPGDEAKIDQILGAFNAGANEAQRAASAFRAGDNAGYYGAESRGREHNARGATLARSYGFRVCSTLGG